jgi:hypothetical protein
MPSSHTIKLKLMDGCVRRIAKKYGVNRLTVVKIFGEYRTNRMLADQQLVVGAVGAGPLAGALNPAVISLAPKKRKGRPSSLDEGEFERFTP